MPRAASAFDSSAQAHATLAARLRDRWAEIEPAAMSRLFAVSPPSRAPDPEYLEGLRAAISAGLEYLLTAVELGEERSPPPPPTVLIQARLAARCGIPLDTVLRRCFAGYTLFGDFLLQEAEEGNLLKGAPMKRLLRTQAVLFDHLVAAVTEEYASEERGRLGSREERRAKRVERLLAGELLDTTELAYDFEGHHIGVVACGPKAFPRLREVARGLDRRLLAVSREDEVVWAWFGGRRAVDAGELQSLAEASMAREARLAIGEPARGLAGWRLTHQQARAALPIALRSSESVVRYADVALFAAALQDDLLATSLRESYLAPLMTERDRGETLLSTLRAYFATDRNVSSAAVALKVDRGTVASRLRTIEQRLGRSIGSCTAELEVALRLEAIGASAPPGTPQSGEKRPASPSTLLGP
jgi:hypothetical protein